jgi:hypothetical protein
MREDSPRGAAHPPKTMAEKPPYDPAKMMRTWKLEVGCLKARGVPAILLGAAAIVLAAGATRALVAGAPNLPETLRELRGLLESREQRRLSG